MESIDLAAWAALVNQGIVERVEWTAKMIDNKRHICLSRGLRLVAAFDAMEFVALSRDEIFERIRHLK